MDLRASAGAALATCVLLGGCASGGGPAPAPEMRRGIEGTETVVQHGTAVVERFGATSPRALLAALEEAYGELGLEITARVGGSSIASQGHRLVRLAERRASWWVDCGTDLSGPIADQARVLLNVVSTVRPAGADATLGTRVDAEARARGGVEGVRECTSTGRLEALIAEETRTRLSGRPGAGGQGSPRLGAGMGAARPIPACPQGSSGSSGTSASDSQSPMKYSS